MESTLLKDLNPQQRDAVTHTDGHIIILAGAGSGKTRCITYKILYLIEKGVNPSNILAITFTNKAATEMQERFNQYTNDQGMLNSLQVKPWVATFHSMCAKILRIDGKYIGFTSRFIIYDTQDQIDAIKQAMKVLDVSVKDFKPYSVHAVISSAKNELLSPSEYEPLARGYFQQTVAKIFYAYQSILKENDALDFDDLISQTIRLFQENNSVLQKYQNRFHYILVDEYQDTNRAQYTLTKLLSQGWQNICIVGDFSQSIYSWRGADYRNLMRFKDDYPDAVTYSLSQNYRSTQKILDGASTVIAKNTSHPVLKLWTNNPEGEEIEIYEAKSEQEEADFIIRTVANLGLKRLQEAAVLYRTNAQSRVIEEAFLHHGMPYILIGGVRFYDRKEIKDIVSYLRVISNEKDMVAYRRLEKIGKRRLEKFLEYNEAIQKSDDRETIKILDGLMKATDYLSLYDEKNEEDRARLENIKELRSVALQFPDLTEFLENISLVEQEYESAPQIDGEKKNAITLMTLHAAKGLEFPIVFIIGMEEGLFPHSRSLMNKEELEEERRLCYVGMTRAKDKLYLTYTRSRLYFGQRTNNMVSRFIFEIPEHVIKQHADMKNIHSDDLPF